MESATARILVLGGTAEARELASRLANRPDLHVVSSLAGRVNAPRLPEGEVRIGGFGGPGGLGAWLRAEQIRAVVDATHPFASRITESAVQATRLLELPLLVLHRPKWHPTTGDDWRCVSSVGEAAELLPDLGDRVFLTTGRHDLAAVAHLDRLWFLARCVDPPDPPLPRQLEVVLARGPYTVEGELSLMRRHRVDVLVTKNSGGELTKAKLAAAHMLGLPVVMVRRPGLPDGAVVVSTVDDAITWLDHVLCEGSQPG
jgi:precorrin-6A/cobalt-precorrin-6A reductase